MCSIKQEGEEKRKGKYSKERANQKKNIPRLLVVFQT